MPTKEELYETAVDLYGEGKLEEAVEKYIEAIAIAPEYVDALHGLAMAYAGLNSLNDAIEIARKVCDLTPDDALAHTTLSIFLQQQGKIKEAEAAGARARVLDWKRQLDDKDERS